MKLIQKSIIRKGDRYLILLRSSKAKYFPGHWDFPGGKLEPGEDPAQGIIREVKEETNLAINPASVFGIYEFDLDNAGQPTHQFKIYISEIIGGSLRISDEHTEYRWATEEEILQLPIEPYLQQFFIDSKETPRGSNSSLSAS